MDESRFLAVRAILCHRCVPSRKDRTVKKMCALVAVAITSLVPAVVLSHGGTALAVCHGWTPFDVTSRGEPGGIAVGQESPKIGVCNHNGGYQSRMRKVGGPAGVCFVARYQTALGVYDSNCTSSSLWQNGPVISNDPFRNGPLYFCTFAIDILLICGDGPWTNNGY